LGEAAIAESTEEFNPEVPLWQKGQSGRFGPSGRNYHEKRGLEMLAS
jgi:hypothetical protein